MKVIITSPFIRLCIHAISWDSISAKRKASKTERADVDLDGVKNADLGRSGSSLAALLCTEKLLGGSRNPAVRAEYESPLTTLTLTSKPVSSRVEAFTLSSKSTSTLAELLAGLSTALDSGISAELFTVETGLSTTLDSPISTSHTAPDAVVPASKTRYNGEGIVENQARKWQGLPPGTQKVRRQNQQSFRRKQQFSDWPQTNLTGYGNATAQS